MDIKHIGIEDNEIFEKKQTATLLNKVQGDEPFHVVMSCSAMAAMLFFSRIICSPEEDDFR